MANRDPRELEVREKTVRTEYVPPSLLPEPTPHPDKVFHWIATSVAGDTTPMNVSTRLREGWVPCRVEDHPEMAGFGNKTGNVEAGGLMLCEMPRALAESRARYYAGMTRQQMESVDNHFMKENDPRMPLFSEKSSSTTRGGFGSGTK